MKTLSFRLELILLRGGVRHTDSLTAPLSVTSIFCLWSDRLNDWLYHVFPSLLLSFDLCRSHSFYAVCVLSSYRMIVLSQSGTCISYFNSKLKPIMSIGLLLKYERPDWDSNVTPGDYLWPHSVSCPSATAQVQVGSIHRRILMAVI